MSTLKPIVSKNFPPNHFLNSERPYVPAAMTAIQDRIAEEHLRLAAERGAAEYDSWIIEPARSNVSQLRKVAK